MSAGPDTSVSPVPDPGLWALRRARVSKVTEKFGALKLVQELFPHAALVRYIQFSPSGKYLATSRWGYTCCLRWGCHLTDQFCLFFWLFINWDRTAMIFRVGVSRALPLLFFFSWSFGLLTVCFRLVGDIHASSHLRACPGFRRSSRLVNCLLVLGKR